MVWVPVVRDVVAKEELPLRVSETVVPFVLNGAVPITVVPSTKFTDPVGVGLVELTVAVNVTDVPRSSVVELWVSVTIVGIKLTTCVSGADVAEL
jgi:hypothetical protein